MKKNHKKTEKGFTLVEMMVSLALFTTAVVVGVGAMLSANLASKKAQDLRQVMDTLNFVVEDFSRTARLGKHFKCGVGEVGSTISISNIETISPLENSLENCRTLAYEPFYDPELESENPGATEQDQIIYAFVEIEDEGLVLFRSPREYPIGVPLAVESMVRMTPPSVDLDASKTSFYVIGVGSEGLTQYQPLINLKINGTVHGRQGTETSLSLQTTVSQRLLDI